MRDLDYSQIPTSLMNTEIMNLLSLIHEYKGKQELFLETKTDVLNTLLKVAKIQSTESSNRIEGIRTSNNRLKAILEEKSEPHNRSEKEIVGYRNVLELVHENYEFMLPRKNIILQMHRDLYAFTEESIGGVFKNSDNYIEEENEKGEKSIRFKPVSAFETPDAMEKLTCAYIDAIEKKQVDPLLLMSRFILDFLCIHPFNDGNGRISRLLTLLLLYRSGYIAGKYISIEMLIEKTKNTYYDALQDSSIKWHEGENDYLPFTRYFLQILLMANKEFAKRVELARDNTLSKTARIKKIFEDTLGKLSKQDVQTLCPDISKSTIELALSELVKEEFIIKTGLGRATAYIRNEK